MFYLLLQRNIQGLAGFQFFNVFKSLTHYQMSSFTILLCHTLLLPWLPPSHIFPNKITQKRNTHVMLLKLSNIQCSRTILLVSGDRGSIGGARHWRTSRRFHFIGTDYLFNLCLVILFLSLPLLVFLFRGGFQWHELLLRVWWTESRWGRRL